MILNKSDMDRRVDLQAKTARHLKQGKKIRVCKFSLISFYSFNFPVLKIFLRLVWSHLHDKEYNLLT